MAGFPGRQLGILGFLISSAPGRGSLKEGHRALHGSALMLPGLQSRGQSRGLTCGWEQGRPGPARWKSAAEPPAIPKFPPSARWDYIRLPRHALQPYPLPLSWDSCPAAVSLQATEWLGSLGLEAEGTIPAFSALAAGTWTSQYPVCFILFRDFMSPRACHP